MNKFNKIAIGALVAVLTIGFVGPIAPSTAFAATTVDLGVADDFSVLAGSSIVDANISSILTGHVGLSPGTSFGALTSAEVVEGIIYAVDATGPDGSAGNNPTLVGNAKAALDNAFIAAGQLTTSAVTSDLGTFNGGVLTPGVYEDNGAPASLGLTGTLTLDAQGDADAVFIFKAESTLTTAADSEVVLINGAQACNVFWQIGSSATLGTNTTFKGTIMANIAITDTGGSTIEGRLLARTGAVTLDNTTITKATCVTPPPEPEPESAPSLSFGESNYWAPLPLINVTKIPSPLALPLGPGSVTYTYIVTNVGAVPLDGVWVKDNKCSDIKFLSGDTNNDSILDLDEEWKYNCVKTLSKTETNTVTAHGSANGWDGYDTANATVVVGVPIVPPLINVVKKPSAFVLPIGGGAITYLYTVTNPGTAPLSNVSIIDNKCTGLPGRVVGHPGDLNKNNLLENNESWSFTCQTNLTQTTTNRATAQGSANGLTVLDFAQATVVVAVPGLPATGIGLDEKSIPWNIVIPAGIFAALTFFYFALRKKIV
ncbi:MAG: ice-binding family protein [bacterium]|nr:ice-binding family protein [bacterium]